MGELEWYELVIIILGVAFALFMGRNDPEPGWLSNDQEDIRKRGSR